MEWIVFAALLAAVSARTGNWTSLRVKYGASEEGNDEIYFYKVPITLSEALAGRWQNISIPNNLEAQFVAVSPGDYGFNPLYDSNGFLGGAQMCQPSQTMLESGPPGVPPTLSGVSEVKNIDGAGYFCSTFLLVDPAVLMAGGRTSADSLGDGLWTTDTTNRISGYTKIPDDVDVLLRDTVYTWQNCFPAMGTHYFYNFTCELDCQYYHSWVPLAQGNDVTGLALQIFGQKTVFNYDWYDVVTRATVESIAPIVNECIYDWADLYGVVSIHVYFTDDPWDIACSDGDSVETKKQQSERLAKLRSKHL